MIDAWASTGRDRADRRAALLRGEKCGRGRRRRRALALVARLQGKSPVPRRGVVDSVVSRYGLTMRRACRLVKHPRSVQYYRSVKPPRKADVDHVARLLLRWRNVADSASVDARSSINE
ncbi:hypothetical protein [Burkholderia paludis]|uniref:hypothetical protein n=1 Tax=Burkholderia paludis TaxID=1506587 RepID=UPI001269FAF7|nr:hypothetical protein [Burkholderia paludis]